jgi:hypothetical protein
MTNLSGTVKLQPTHRLFESMRKLCVVVDALGIAVSFIRLNRVEAKMGNYVACLSLQFPMEVRLASIAPVTSIAWDRPVSGVEIGFFDATKGPNYQNEITGTKNVLMGLITPIYVDFYEKHRPWIGKTLGALDKWPELFRFAWAVRNAISHHGGKINITDPKLRPVVWHKLSYDYHHAGTEIIGPVLALADMIILMFEISDELDRLKCPINL